MIDGAHLYGSDHTAIKNSCVYQYLSAYSVALKNKPFFLAYIDAFAGSGDRAFLKSAAPLFGEEEILKVVDGSARLALSVEPPLDLFVFIEKDRSRYRRLCALEKEFPDRKIKPYHGDANDSIKEICRSINWDDDKRKTRPVRAVMFLDPFGMHVDFETLQAIADTKAIDVWYWFSLMGLYRQATLDIRNIDAAKCASLNRVPHAIGAFFH